MGQEIGTLGFDIEVVRYWGGHKRGFMYQITTDGGHYIQLSFSELMELKKVTEEERSWRQKHHGEKQSKR